VTPSAEWSEPRRDRLRVSVRLDSAEVPRWIILLLEALAGSDRLELTGVAFPAAAGEEPPPVTPGRHALAALTLGRFDERVFSSRAVLSTSADASSWARRNGVRIEFGDPADVRAVADGGSPVPNVVIDLREPAAAHAHPYPADVTAWRVTGVPTRPGWSGAVEPSGIVRSVVSGDPTLAVEVRLVTPVGEATLARAVCPTHPCSLVMTAAYLGVSALQLLLGELERSQQDGLLDTRAISDVEEEPDGAATASQTAGLCGDLSAGLGYVARSVAWGARGLGWVRQWYLLLGIDAGDGLDVGLADMRPLAPPPGHFWADPHVVTDGELTHVFFEDFHYSDQKGRISRFTLDSAGRPGPARIVLETDAHLSYPFVFRHGGRLFMIPESAGSRTVDLYECTRTPDEWTFRRSLLTAVSLVDATVVEWGGRWWMFASLEQPFGLRGADVLLLYSADDPVIGEWTLHPASPIAADVRHSRSAGALFVHDGRLFRPSQDGSHDYGWGVAINEVLSLTADDYTERCARVLTPPPGVRMRGTHTLNRAGRVTVMDAWQWVPRASAAFRAGRRAAALPAGELPA
jgi:hypothetical protein